MKKVTFALMLILIVSISMSVTIAQDDMVTLDILAQGDSWDPENYYLPVIEESVGINLEYRMVPGDQYVEVRNVVMASGDLPDMLRISPTEAVYSEYVDAGLLLPLNDLLDAYPVIRDAFPADVWEAARYEDGNIYHIPRVTGLFPQTIAYRGDWADTLGIEHPVTTEDFQAMLQAFKDEDPAGLGGAMIPLVPNRLSGDRALEWIDPLLYPFGVNNMAWVPSEEDPNQLILANTKESFKDALQYVRGLYEAELLDQTWGVATERGLFKFYAGIAGATTDWPQFSHLRLEAIVSAFPDSDASIRYITGLVGPDGTQGGPTITPFAQGLGSAVTTSATPEQAEAFFKMIEWQYTDGYELMTLGVEGKTFDIGEDGIKRRLGRDAVLENDPEYDLYMLDRVFYTEPPEYFAYSRQNPTWNDVTDEMFSYVTEVLVEVDEVGALNYGANTNSEVYNDNINAIESIVNEFAIRAILTPDFDIDAEFESFLAELEENNLSAITAEINALNSVEDINALMGN